MNTKTIIQQAAFSLFSQRKFKDITVQDILDRAKCSRYSFYRYYKDKYELMRLYYTSYVTELLCVKYNGDNFPEIQARIFQFVLDNRGYFESVKDLRGADSFWSFLTSYTAAFFSTVKHLNTSRVSFSEEEDYEMAFVVNGAIGIFQRYVEERKPVLSPEQVSVLLCTHYPKEYYVLPREKIEAFSSAFGQSFSKDS